jgi:hypothetical protein
MQYKGTKKAIPEIARELNVDAVLEGTVTRDHDRVRIMYLRAGPGCQLLSNPSVPRKDLSPRMPQDQILIGYMATFPLSPRARLKRPRATGRMT